MLLDSQVLLPIHVEINARKLCTSPPPPLPPTLFSLFSVVELDSYHSESSDSKVGIICLLIYQAVILFWFVSGYLLFLLDQSV